MAKATKKKTAKKSMKKTTKKVAKKMTKKAVAPKSTAKKAAPKMAKAIQPAGKSSVGQPAPDISLAATGGQTLNLRHMQGRKVVLYFYPKDMTPGCTIEGHEFTKLKDQFEAQNAVVLGVSRDTVELHEKFKAKECYTIDLLADTDQKLCNTFGVIKDKNMYGKMVKGIERSTFLIDENGKVVHEWRGVKAEGHANEVLNYLKGW